MKKKFVAVFAILILLTAALPVMTAGAGKANPVDPIAISISDRLKNRQAPAQLSAEEAAAVVAASPTTVAQCGGDGETLTITIPSFDAANPGDQDVVFWKESVGSSATIWVAWDFLVTAYGREDVITCDQITYLQGAMDSIVDTDTYYFGGFDERPDGNTNLDVMIYNIVDESFFDPTFGSYIAGFFWGALNNCDDGFCRNMMFIDTYDWEDRLGSDVSHPYLYEGTVAHELEHLIHNDHDSDEVSWIDEGMADLAIYLNGFGHPDSHVVYYMAFHRTPLTSWGSMLEDYGASYLFQLYMLENFGTGGCDMDVCPTGWDNTWTMTEIDEQANSIAGVEAITGENFNDLFDAWIVANYADDPSQTTDAGLPIGYSEINLAPYVSPNYGAWSIARSIKDIYGSSHHGNLPTSRYYGGYISGTVEYPIGALSPYTPLYGSFKGIQPEMKIYLQGDAQSGIAPNSDTYEAASGGGNLLTDRMLTLDMDVSGTLTFWTWYDIETEWDYGFVEVSTDGGPWTPLAGSITSYSEDPNGSTAWTNSLIGGQADSDTVITGNSGGWVEATFTLPAGNNRVRFSYYTDEAVNGQGWFIDDVSVDTFSDGFESGSSDWTLGGWTVTTGLFDNDWQAAFVTPVYNNGKFDHLDFGYTDTNVLNGPYEIEVGAADTSNAGNDAAMVVIANRPGDENPFDGGYLILVDKGDASKK